MRSPVKPKKFLGQHFLKDMDIARRIAETMIGYAGVPILEIGPGTGVLTRFLLAAGHDLTVVEIDRESGRLSPSTLSRTRQPHSRRRFPKIASR